MAIASSLQQYLERNHIYYEVISHPRSGTMRAAAHCAGLPEDAVVKAVLVEDDDGFMLAAVPASCNVELNKLAKVVNRPVDLATESDIATLFTDCEPGALPPVGAAYGVDVVVDDSLDDRYDLYFEGGDHCTLIHVKGEDFERLIPEARHASIRDSGR
ncbi:YbaK/EbsC family protein [uncultured Ferrovibrio sp.]|jgi:Ala-tRNA(Pro) deacylase|uniref:aminoacyl-tRNA deacylase n=1 Tax=uncultured Ferrovibrio sp. TaxID=1576913 RepID=UPI002601A849|nr:YbaK/EbsC family protein [uncultured Ferrovibrio sp.]